MNIMKKSDYGGRYTWVQKDCSSNKNFGEIWFNAETGIIFIRQVVHEFEDLNALVLEGRELSDCEYIGDL